MSLVPVADVNDAAEARSISTMARYRLRHPANAVSDDGIDLKRKRRPTPVTISPPDQNADWGRLAIGPCNAEVIAALRGPFEPLHNPMVIYGDSGVGKTAVLKLFASATHGIYQSIESMLWRALDADQSIPVALDDIGFASAQVLGRLAVVLSQAITARRRVVLALRSPLADDHHARFSDLISGGLTLKIDRPDRTTRAAIIRCALADTVARHPGFALPDAAIKAMADTDGVTGRGLIGALGRVLAQWQYGRIEPSVAGARSAIAKYVTVREHAPPQIKRIQHVVAYRYGVSLEDMLSERRATVVVWPRHIAMYLAKTLTLKSLPEIGRRFGGRDHTSVLFAVRKIERLKMQDSKLVEELAALVSQLSGGSEQ